MGEGVQPLNPHNYATDNNYVIVDVFAPENLTAYFVSCVFQTNIGSAK